MVTHETTEAEFNTIAGQFGVLTKFHGGLYRYLHYRIPTGSFLQAVLEFDRAAAIEHADSPHTRMNISNITGLLRHEFPVQSYGSAQNVRDWLAHKPTFAEDAQ